MRNLHVDVYLGKQLNRASGLRVFCTFFQLLVLFSSVVASRAAFGSAVLLRLLHLLVLVVVVVLLLLLLLPLLRILLWLAAA